MNDVRLFGKLPAHGDFVARGLNAGDRDDLDAWLSASLSDARDVLAEAFAERYDAAPPWRFVAPSDGAWQAGAMAPSVDAAGRRFPILIAIAGLSDASARAAAARCEELLYDALANRWDADTLAAVAREASIDPDDPARHAEWWTLGGEDFDPAAVAAERPHDLFTLLLKTRKIDQ